MLKIQSTKKNEKGVALIFTLLMLSLLLIMAMGFVLDSMFSQKSAYNAANTSAARFLAEVQLKQVLNLIKNNRMNAAEGYIYSKDLTYGTPSPPPPVEDYDMLQEQTLFPSRLRVDDVLDKYNNIECLTTSPPKVNWNYIKDNSSGPQNIIGRTAFVVIPDKVPLDSLVDDRTLTAGTATATYPQHNEKNDTETRIGKYVSEINVRAAIPAGMTNISTITEKLNWTTVTSGLYNGTNWKNFLALFTALPDIIPNEKAVFASKLSLAVTDDKEAFWADSKPNTKIDNGELYKRFDLTRDWTTTANTWDTSRDFVYYNILLMSNPTVIEDSIEVDPGVTMEKWADVASIATSKGLPWLACFGYDKDGNSIDLKETFPTTTLRRCQIAANLKDYCDIDDNPTSNIDPTTWNGLGVGNHPLFTGNERTPYINKIGVRVDSDLSNAVGPTTSMTITVKPYIGLINIYDTAYVSDVRVIVTGTVELSVSLDGVVFATPTININSTFITVASATNWLAANGYSDFVEGNASTPDVQSVPVATATAEVKVTKITITKVVLYEAAAPNTGYDYVKTLKYSSPLPAGFVSFPVSAATGTKYGWLGFEVNDPRQNLNEGDWCTLTPQQNATPDTCFAVTALYACNPNAGNGNAVIGTVVQLAPNTVGNYDPEIGNNPANNKLSTAFIRNAPMESPWELGFIHRGAMWQTLNLKKFYPKKAITTFKLPTPDRYYIAGGGLYADGDANILDQIKMTDAAKSPQKINLSASDDIFFDALFSKIRLSSDIENDCSLPTYMSVDSMAGYPAVPTNLTEKIDTTTVAPTDYTKMRAAIIVWFKTPNLSTFTNLTRASIVGISTGLLRANVVNPGPTTISFTAAPTTDAVQEELIGKIANLTKVGGDFKIIVLAQTIKDIGGTGILITKVAPNETTIKTQNCTTGAFDKYIDPLNNPNMNVYFDEITSEQKILVSGSWNGTNLKINSFQYVE